MAEPVGAEPAINKRSFSLFCVSDTEQAAQASGAAAFAADYPSLALLLHVDFCLAGQFAVAIDSIIQLVWPWLGVKASRCDQNRERQGTVSQTEFEPRKRHWI